MNFQTRPLADILLNHEVKHDSLVIAGTLIICLIAIGTVFFHFVEGHHWFDSFYFVVMTMSTVGYGDIVPLTIAGKILTIIYALTGVPLFIFAASFFVEYRIRNVAKGYIKKHNQQIIRVETDDGILEEQVDVEKIEEIPGNK